MSLFRRDSQQTAEKLVAKGKIEAAIKEYRKLLGRMGDDPTTLNRVGDLYVRLRKNDEAVSFYTKTAEKYASDGFYVKAIAVYKKIHRIEPSQIEVHRKLAELYQRQGLKNDARSHYSQLADHYLRNEDTAAAIDVCRKMVDLEPENPSHHLKLADLHREAGNLSEALRSYGSIASLMLSHSQLDHAFQVYERAVRVDPTDMAFAAEAVTALKAAGDVDKAVALVELSESLHPEASALRSLISETEVPSEEPAGDTDLQDDAEAAAAEEARSGELVLDLEADSSEESETPAADGEPVRDSSSGEWSFVPEPELEDPEFEVELDLDFAEAGGELEVGAAPDALGSVEEPAPLPASAEDTGPQEEVSEAAFAEVEPTRDETPSREMELLSEADVFFKYGLADKGLERLEEVLEVTPSHPEALRRMIPILVEKEEHQRVVALAESLQSSTAQHAEPDAWNAVQTTLAGAGYTFDGGRVLAPSEAASEASSATEPTFDADIPEPVEPVQPPDDMLELDDAAEPLGDAIELDLDADVDPGELLAQLDDEETPVEAASEAPSEAMLEIDTPELDLAAEEVAPEVPAEPAGLADADEPAAGAAVDPPEIAPAPEPSEPVAEPPLAAPVEDLTPPAEEQVAAGEQPAVAELAELDGSTEWLDSTPEAPSDKLFEDEAEFFDLAAALEGEMGDGEAESAVEEPVELASEGEQSLDEIVEGFKRGVSENISDEDSDTHYNLGIAYREMMLLDEAIGEFQISARDDRYLVDSCAMLGLCFRDKGLPDLAIKWYQKALAQEDLPSEQRLGMLYDMGTAYEDLDDPGAALAAFTDLSNLDSGYRDVGAKIASLQPS